MEKICSPRNRYTMLTPEEISRTSLVMAMGCSVADVCPRPMLAQMRKKFQDWNLDDPKGKSIEEARMIRDEIERKVTELGKAGRLASLP